MYSVERYHDFSAGHRVVGHESKCQYLHGHNYRVHFTCVSDLSTMDAMAVATGASELDNVGRVIDFGVIKSRLANWLEENWDHQMIMWSEDKMLVVMPSSAKDSIVEVPFNPTAENMAKYLVTVVGPQQLRGTGVVLRKVRIEETRKCSATYTRTD